MKVYYIANARIPTEKAHGIQIAKMCEAFIEAGVDVTLVVPRRTTKKRSMREYYQLRVDVPIVYIPALDWHRGGRLGYALAALSFILFYVFFLWRRKIAGEKFVLYTVDTDTYSSSALTLLSTPLFSEMHGAKKRTLSQRILFKKATGIIAINQIIAHELQVNFPRSNVRYIVEPNGVDLSAFSRMDKKTVRDQLGLPQDVPIVLYAGRFFEWKGLEILLEAARATPTVRWQMVGGTQEEFERLIKTKLTDNFFFAGNRPHGEMPLWFAAADALLVLGTARDIQSYRYTSPMKLFEYLATERPIIASDTPAIREIVSDNEVLFYKPDSILDLARVVQYAVTHTTELEPHCESALRLAQTLSWRSRAERIVRFIEETTCT